MSSIDKILEVYADNVRGLFALAVSIVREPAEAEDVLQDVLIKLLSDGESMGKVRQPFAFLRSCVRNEAIDHVRSLGREDPAPFELLGAVRDCAAEDEYSKVESMMWLRSYIMDQPEEMQRAFAAYAIDGRTITQIARGMGLRPDTLRKRFDVIKERIRRTEKKNGFRF